jgi:CBS domain containing-hemolysin-like protein
LLVFEKTQVLGFIHVIDAQHALLAGKTRAFEILHPVQHITTDLSLDKLLQRMQKSRTGLVVVSDRECQPVGILTPKDILEELVGAMEDEMAKR